MFVASEDATIAPRVDVSKLGDQTSESFIVSLK